MTLEELHEKCRACTRCRLRETATQVVPGEGSPDSDIMFIGEGPGKVEDKTGRPFVGPAGKFLDELLAGIGLQREEVFIANMVKCRPPENRDPQEDEMETCRPWLDKQIEVIDPKVFVPLGRFAMKKFLPSAVISKEHGNLYERSGRVYFVMYHPAVALYNGSMRPVLKEDIETLKRYLEGEEVPRSLDDTVSAIISKKSDLRPDGERKKSPGESGQVGMAL
jgi:uracil-DNA glycosylase